MKDKMRCYQVSTLNGSDGSLTINEVNELSKSSSLPLRVLTCQWITYFSFITELAAK